MTSRIVASGLAIIACIMCVSTANAAQQIRVGYAQVSEEPLWLMGTPGGVTPNNGKAYDLQLTMFKSSADRMKAYEAGALDCETGNPVSLLFAAASGLSDFSAVAVVSKQHPGGVVTSFMVRNDGTINKPGDLKGKIIAMNGYKSFSEVLIRAALAKAGLNPDRDVHITLLGYPQGPDALRQKLVDMIQVDEPAKTVELRKGGVKILFSVPDVIGGDLDQNTLFCNKDFLKKNAVAVRAFLTDYIATLHAYLKDRRKADDELAKAGLIIQIPANEPLPDDFTRPLDGRVNTASWKKVEETMLKSNLIPAHIDVDTLIDNSYLPRSR